MVKIKVDLENREKLRRLHTATHIVNYCAREVLGNHVWQNGSNLKAEFGTLDITHYDNLSDEEIFEIEKLANKTVFEDKKVTIEELERGEAEKKYGYTLYQGGAIPMKKIRIIKVLDSDIEACGGIHMEKTGGIGLIKIIETSKIQDGVVRLKYVVNEFALDEVNSKQKILSESSEIFNVNEKDLPKTCSKFFNEWKDAKKEIEKLKDKMKDVYLNLVKGSNETEHKFDSDIDMGTLTEIFKASGKDKLKIEVEKFIITSNDFSVEGCKKEINKGDHKVYIK